ncbi:Transcription factor cwo [Chionoecetes opilio]|uniref:Transcription factor cwo n=1 Tax=Chionoecetes opilio TaxID=41210 RepID=A0A8J8WNL2_CHIOP|nr:Transcription factor cwo [Chionoecetes opilio]
MNNCLADLSRLIPTYYLKKGRGRIEKTEIIEMAIKYMKHLQAHAYNCEVTAKQEKTGNQLEQFHLGYQECMSETMQFLVESEGFFSGDSLCVRLMNHLTKHCEKILNSEGYVSRQSGASSSSSGYHANSSSAGSSSDGNGNGSIHASESIRLREKLLRVLAMLQMNWISPQKESASRSEDRPGSDEREDKMGGCSSLDGSSGVGSQLREILQQHSGPNSGERRCGGYSSGLSSNNSSSGDDNNNTSNSRLYKFKSNMKHRFSADLEQSHQVRKKRRDSESSCGNYTDYEKDRVTPNGPASRATPSQDGFPADSAKLDGLDSPVPDKHCRSPTPKCEGQMRSSSPSKQAPEGTVPIFALNQNGSFYVPLTIDNSLIAPIMSGITDTSPVLHPISISVNFCGPFPTITSSVVPPGQPGSAGTHVPNAHHFLNSRYSHMPHGTPQNSFESGLYNSRPHTRTPYERKRREPVRHTQYEEHRIGLSAGGPEGVEKREPCDMDIKDHHHHHHHHHPLHQEAARDLPTWLEHMQDIKDIKDQEKPHEIRDMRNVRTGNLRDLRDAREMWEMRDSAQTVREYIDASGTYTKNAAYSRTPSPWTPTYHVQPKN